MKDLSAWNNSLWLAHPEAFQRNAIRAASYGRCYTREEILAEHKRSLEQADTLVASAIQGGGDTLPLENAIDVLAKRIESDEITASSLEFARSAGFNASAPRAIRAVKGKIGVIPIHGPVDQRMSSELMKAGGTSLDFVSRAFDNLMNDSSIGAIVLHIDSPGGSTYGTEELATKIYDARGTKPIYAIADAMAASAAYWIGTAADMMIVTPSGDVGSVGVYAMHIDQSRSMEALGLTVTMIQAGRYKTELSPFGKLSAEAVANVQESVNATYDRFINALKRNRGTSVENVRENFGQGRVVRADVALSRGMVDRVLSFESLIAKLTGSHQSAPGPQKAVADMATLRARVQHLRMKELAV